MVRRPARGAVRIIGGRWRGSRLAVVDVPGVRPSADRVRETLFNWLAPVLPGARCLDLFAGTGALGFEAASRGAGTVDLVERDPALVEALASNRERLCAAPGADPEVGDVRVHRADALAWLAAGPMAAGTAPCDVVFVDPPFDADLVPRVLAALLDGWLRAEARVYVERPLGASAPGPAWRIVREGRTRHVDYALLTPSG